jgi:pimeloyl-ACP methyl ester carboxylesterase
MAPLVLLACCVGGASAQAQEAVDWQPCELTAREGSRAGECAAVPLPLDPSAPEGPTLDVAVTRILPDDPVRGQLWFLDGGPGDAGRASLARVAEALPDVRGIALYTLDHRGVGGTALLECPDQQSGDSVDGREVTRGEWAPCMDWLRANRPDLEFLSTTASARDLDALIDQFRLDGIPVFVMGASYGSFWANRYLQVTQQPPDGVILDGIAPADWTFAEFDGALDQMGRRLLELCTRDPVCGPRLGGDAVARAEGLMAALEQGHCADLTVDPPMLRLLLGNLLMGGRDLWPYIPIIVHRMDQCAIRDILAIAHLFEALFETGAISEPGSHSQVLQRHVALSEMWPDPPPDPALFDEALERVLMTTAVSAHFAASAAEWPTYARPDGGDELASYSGPMLLLHGGLDPTVPLDRLEDVRAHFSAPGQTFVEFPLAGHVVLGESPCASAIYAAFLASPTEAPDTRCAVEGEPVSFVPADPKVVLGTNDAWGDIPIELLVVGGAGLAILLVVGGFLRWRLARRRQRIGNNPQRGSI